MMRYAGRILGSLIVILILISISSVTVVEANENNLSSKKCNALWFELANKYGRSNYDVLLKKWLMVSDRCRGTGIYEFRLGTLYERLGRHSEFKKIVHEGLALNSPYEHYLKVSKLTVLLNEAARDKRIDDELEKKLIEGYQSLINSHKDWVVPYESLSNVYLLFRKPDEAIFYAKKALEINKSSWVGHRGLVIGYTYKKKYNEARPHIVLAAEKNENLFADVEFMCAAAWVYASLDEHDYANSILNRLTRANPRAKNTDRMKRTYFYAKKRYEDSLKNK